MTEVVLVGCTKTKRDHPAEARDLYDESALFRKRRRVARIRGDWWSILSAEHGLVRPENWVEPYDTNIGNVDSEAWAEKVLDILLDDLARHDDPTVTIFAGKKYVDPLLPDLEAEGYEVLDPLRGLMPGQRMSKLDDMAEETEQTKLVTDGGTENYPYVRAHLCKECGNGFEEGDELVALSDGYADEEMSYEVNNLRFFHADCWRNSQYMDTGTDQEADRR